MIAQSFSSSIDRERDAAVQTYHMVVDVLDLLGDNASPGTAANTVALVLHKLGSGGSNTAARIRFGAQMTETGDTVLLDAAPEPADDGTGITRIVSAGNNRHCLMLSATADGTGRHARVRRDGGLHRAPDAAARLPHDVCDPHRHRRSRVVGHVLSADAPARHTFPRVAGAGARQPQLPGAGAARATRWGSSRPTSTAWPNSSSATSTVFRRVWPCRSGSWPTSRTR